MKVVVIGTGNVAQMMIRALLAAEHEITQVIGRNQKMLDEICLPFKLASATSFDSVNKHADVYIIAVTDQAIASVAEQLHLPDALIVHTAGSVPASVLNIHSKRTGVFYPLQSIRKETERIPSLSLLVHAAEEKDLLLLQQLAGSIAEKVMVADDQQRGYYHLAAVIANNFSNHLYTLTDEYCTTNGIDFKALLPMLKEQVLRLETSKPAAMQTGPAIRKDQTTIDKHLALLDEEMRQLYEWFTRSIQKHH